MAGSAATTHLFDRLFDTSGSVGFFQDHRAEFEEFTEAYVFFHDLDAIVAGFYEPGRAFTEGGGSADQRFCWSDVPHLVLRDHRGAELWLGGCNCGYRGTGPWGSRQVLIQAGFPAGLVDQLPHYRLLYLDRLAGTFTGQRPTNEEQQAEVFYPGCPDFDTKVRRIRWHDWLLLVDDAPVRLLEPAAPDELLEKWTVYAPLLMPNPTGAVLYLDDDAAVSDGYRPPDHHRPQLGRLRFPRAYSFIVWDASGRQVWLPVPIRVGRWRLHDRGVTLITEIARRCNLRVSPSAGSLAKRVRAAGRGADRLLHFTPAPTNPDG
jgi:hypothetical protein